MELAAAPGDRIEADHRERVHDHERAELQAERLPGERDGEEREQHRGQREQDRDAPAPISHASTRLRPGIVWLARTSAARMPNDTAWANTDEM